MHRLYLDIPAEFQYDWSISNNCNTCLQYMLGLKHVKFICNRNGGISSGDLYEVELLDDEIDVTFYLRTGFKPISENVKIKNFITMNDSNPEWGT